MALVTCRDLVLGYDGDEVARGISFDIERSDYLCIVGENGSGKSTLMRVILGLQPPLSGTVALGDGLLQREIGYLPQQTVVQKDFPATVWEIVLSGCQARCGLRPYYDKVEKQLARDNIDRMGITHLTRRCYRELSGGQQQRVLLARALCAASEMLFLDEPTAGLDPEATAEMYGITEELNRDGMTVVMISHDIEATLRRASHVLHMGANVFFGTCNAYERAYLLRKEGRLA